MAKAPATTPVKEPAKPMSQAGVYAERALSMMQSLHVMPTPQNYSIFFACAAGRTAVVKEVEKAIAEKTPLTEEFLGRLYALFIGGPQTQIMNDTTLGAKRVLSDILKNVDNFAGETHAISQEVSQHIEKLGDDADEHTVRRIADTLRQGAQSIKNSSDSMASQLANAQAEILELRETLSRAMTEAERDFLTGVFNRKAFDRRIHEAIDHAKHEKTELTLLMIDIDHFKRFNDSFGHLIGDEVLKVVAKTLLDTLKGMDCVARYGGEEFSVILPSTPMAGGMAVGEAIRKTVSSKELKRKTSGENYGVVTVSIGVATLRANDTVDSLIARADEALYISKGSGRNRVTQEVANH